MPIYEYTCLDCGKHFDALRSMKDADASIPCENCESLHTKRSISVFFAQSGGHTVAGTSSGCSGCSSTSCASCNN